MSPAKKADSHASTTTSYKAPAASDPHAAAPGAAPHWVYLGHGSQEHWGELSQDFTACVDGSAQTPIDIRDTILTQIKDMEFHYQPAAVSVLNNGHTIQANYAQNAGGYMVVDGTQYQLLQFHFHWPSEHTVGGKQFLMEAHLVHKSASGALAVLGIFPGPGELQQPAGPHLGLHVHGG
ncbi:MAG: hypothetical protein EXR46_09970 [Dehalococcoidia bacterium]|nr:hypothetical protein [Dehalococcoidia bacterium]